MARRPFSFKDFWLTEAVRLREDHWGPLDDAALIRQLRSGNDSPEQKIVRRARLLADRENTTQLVEQWTQGAKLALLILAVLAIMAGAGAAAGVLGSASRHINVTLAIVTLLGLHSLTFLFWILSLFLSSRAFSWLGQFWLWLSRKIARGPEAALAPQSFVSLLTQNSALKWALSCISHGFWVLFFLAALLTMLGLLAAQRYTFGWETTILSPEVFVSLTRTLGALPALLGFPIPDAEWVRQSTDGATLSESTYAIWSAWLLGVVLCYGLLLRAISLALCLWQLRGALQALRLDIDLPSYSPLVARLTPTSENLGIDGPAGDDLLSQPQDNATRPYSSDPVYVGIELPPDTSWPVFPVIAGAQDGGVLESREQRHALLDQLHAQPVKGLLVVVDAAQTPDRGTLRLIAELAGLARATHILLWQRPDQASRQQSWQKQLSDAGFLPDTLHLDAASLPDWIAAS
ncbi:DUF2868 domain-containing protein [Advenella mimigardefordensis]|uniref:Putative membrane protein n=1 Tax=Advenella mimigardefordensis (strain DSM 17166 / LMG 22922 / DPN7) TaxID=1247726 RepID=W0P6H9_ADVMD|nr:DUF2868 domain-containing protein [Advenella mimigardefordensis]AHG62474.1 putative membrane protein [Advenella mimigardefordensis DPN7]